MTLEVTLTIDPAVVGTDRTALVAARLMDLGGTMVSWQPGLNGAPAIAIFKLKNPARRDHFVADALAIPGVLLATRLSTLHRTQGREEHNEQESR